MSNLLKRGTTTISEERIIDYNELIKLKLKNIANDRENHGNVDADGFVNGLKADVVEQLLTGSDEDGETAQSQEMNLQEIMRLRKHSLKKNIMI